ncbi:MAG: BlaI/MecI/CopY family transcriptional regulator [bacterium]
MSHYLIRPDATGLRAALFDLEADIMEVVWGRRWDEFAVSQVHEVLASERDIAYTTVMTTVSRLFDKELLARRKDGKRYLYSPVLTRDEFLRAMTREVLDRLPAVARDEAVSYLVDSLGDADAETLDRLEQLILRRKQELK